MSISYTWYDARETILHVFYESPWDWSDFHRAHAEINDLLDQHPMRVVIVADMRRTTRMPDNAITHLRSLLVSPHPALDGIVLVSDQMFVRIIATMAIKLFGSVTPLHFRYVPTLEEALRPIA